MNNSKDKETNQTTKKPASQLRNFARLSGIAFQMGGTIFVCAYVGKKLDEHYGSEKKWCTMGFVLFGVAASLYLVLKQLNKINSGN